jgi:hypothetical protein
MDLKLDKSNGTKYSLHLDRIVRPRCSAKGQSHRKMATQNHGSKAVQGQDRQVAEYLFVTPLGDFAQRRLFL